MKLFILLFAFLANSLISPAQKQVVSVGNTKSLTVKAGTIFSADSLVLIPGADFTLSSNTIQMSATAVNLTPNPSISRVYSLSSPIIFTGTVRLYYQPSELNGNLEGSLLLTDSTTSVPWQSEAASSVNTILHYVQYSSAAQSFTGATASGLITILPLSLISFTGNWNNSNPALEWVVAQNGESASYIVESSPDGASWKSIGSINGPLDHAVETYDFTDTNPSGLAMYYRIRLIEPSGQFTYSYVIRLQKGSNGNEVRLAIAGNTVSIRFSGTPPSAVRLINVSGMVLRSDNTSRREYDLSGLIPGIYFIQYEINGQWSAREFVVQ